LDVKSPQTPNDIHLTQATDKTVSTASAAPSDPLRRPIVVIGSARSGTTVLAELLAQHPDVHYEEEPRLTWRIGNDRKSDLLRPEDARPDVIREIRERFADRVRSAGKTRLLEKTPSNALRLAFIDAVMPDAVFIHILRDGVEASLSIRDFWTKHTTGLPTKALRKRLLEIRPGQVPHYAKEVVRRLWPNWMSGVVPPAVWGPRLPGIDSMVRELDSLDVACLQWKLCVERCCVEGRKLPADRYRELWLEDLDATTLDQIQHFAGLEPCAEVQRRFVERFERGQATSRKGAASAEDLERVREWVEPTAAWLSQTSPRRSMKAVPTAD